MSKHEGNTSDVKESSFEHPDAPEVLKKLENIRLEEKKDRVQLEKRSNAQDAHIRSFRVIGTANDIISKRRMEKQNEILEVQRVKSESMLGVSRITKKKRFPKIGKAIKEMETKTDQIERKLQEIEEKLRGMKKELLEKQEKIKLTEEAFDYLKEESTKKHDLLFSQHNEIESKFEDYKKEKEQDINQILEKNLEELRELEKMLSESKEEEESRINDINEASSKKIKENEILLVKSKEEKSKLLAKIKELEKALEENYMRTKEIEAKVADMESSEMKKDAHICLLKTEKENLTNTIHEVTLLGQEKQEIIIKLGSLIEERDNDIFTLEKKLKDGEKLRRKLHNEVLELKGNIRVFCRVRPSLKEKEISTENIILPPVPENTMIDIRIPTDRSDISGLKRDRLHHFEFDRIFPPESTQETVFSEIEQLVQSVLDGYRVCIFAYGQTGSGKTYTMEGPEDVYSSENMHTDLGMIPRAVEQIFATCELLSSRGWNFTINTSFLEIYNETIRDLLSQDREEKKHDIKHSETGTTVTGLSIITVTDPISTLSLLKSSAQKRSFASTLCNERSSRSHTVFILQVIGINEETKERVEGVLNLIDLAGSERLSQSGSTGDRLKETQAINKSLSSLGDVISALYNKDAHIPYRNSKLTYLLSKSLGGNSKTLMFANISPETQDLNETLCSLRFATKVNSCEIGTARKKNS
eukprot:GHVP01035373.1.p1 GENE.GHVP01035373.1~~GHVP01035373.1.p1  ORF type:complete len:701 (+),score=157.23 GHVP01035373.1:319-2421(+)